MSILNDIMDQWKRQTGGDMYPILTKQRAGVASKFENILDRLDRKESVMVCKECERPRALGNKGYVEIRRFHADAKCDGCEEFKSVAMWIFNDNFWHSDLKHEVHLNGQRRQQRDIARMYR